MLQKVHSLLQMFFFLFLDDTIGLDLEKGTLSLSVTRSLDLCPGSHSEDYCLSTLIWVLGVGSGVLQLKSILETF